MADEHSNAGVVTANKLLQSVLGDDAPHRKYFVGWLAVALPVEIPEREAVAEKAIAYMLGNSSKVIIETGG